MRAEELPSPDDEVQYSHHGWGWRLLPPVLEEEYEQDARAARNAVIRRWHGIGLAVNLVTCLLALWATPELSTFILVMYLGIVLPIFVVCRRALAVPLSHSRQLLASGLPVLVTYLAGLTVFAFSPVFEFRHSMSLLAMGIIWSGSPIPLRVPETILVVGLGLLLGGGINLVSAILHDTPFDHLEVVIFSLVMIALTLFSRLMSERRIRKSFVIGLALRRRADALESSNQALKVLSDTDPLTGLYNRHSFDLQLQALWAHSVMRAAPIAAMMIDVDRFKQVNDTHGHLLGDRCLVMVAREIERNLRREDFAARYGGDEFVVLMTTDKTNARATAERIRSRIDALAMPGAGPPQTLGVTASIGVAVIHPAASDFTPTALIDAADAALLAAKRAGRDCVVVDGEPVQGMPPPADIRSTRPA